MGSVIQLEAVIPQERDLESLEQVDCRYRASFLDLGELTILACQMSQRYRHDGQAPFPRDYVSEVKQMLLDHVRHVVAFTFDEETGSVLFTTEDHWGSYTYGFHCKPGWFAKA
jgi:hypothetical protein